MNPTLRLTSADRVLVLAPHPDDESIGCGGLLLAARDAGAARRVIVLTDGDNNPWPQRWIEKRWRIDDTARARWGARRRAEAQAALDVLGIPAGERAFLGLPDTGLTALLMQGEETFVAPLRRQIADFKPTHLALPALADRHPDHSAAHVAARFAVGQGDLRPSLLAYRVHGEDHSRDSRVVELSAGHSDLKRRAIASHRTQMALSGKRFLAFATQHETYGEGVVPPRDDHPLTATLRSDNVLELRVREESLRDNRQVLVVLGDASGSTRAWHFALPSRTQTADVHDARDHRIVTTAEWRSTAEGTLYVPLPSSIAACIGFIKLAKLRPGLVVFDRYGWQTVDLSARA